MQMLLDLLLLAQLSAQYYQLEEYFESADANYCAAFARIFALDGCDSGCEIRVGTIDVTLCEDGVTLDRPVRIIGAGGSGVLPYTRFSGNSVTTPFTVVAGGEGSLLQHLYLRDTGTGNHTNERVAIDIQTHDVTIRAVRTSGYWHGLRANCADDYDCSNLWVEDLNVQDARHACVWISGSTAGFSQLEAVSCVHTCGRVDILATSLLPTYSIGECGAIYDDSEDGNEWLAYHVADVKDINTDEHFPHFRCEQPRAKCLQSGGYQEGSELDETALYGASATKFGGISNTTGGHMIKGNRVESAVLVDPRLRTADSGSNNILTLSFPQIDGTNSVTCSRDTVNGLPVMRCKFGNLSSETRLQWSLY